MANATLQRVGELIRCVFELLWNRTDGMPARELIALVPNVIKLTQYELGWSASTNIQRYEKMIRLATTPLVKAGWMIKNEKGRWYITQEGRQACRSYSNVQVLYAEALRLSEVAKQSTPEILMSLEIVQERAWQLVESYLQERKPMEIRTLLADLMAALEYHIVWIAPIEKKHGQIDMVISADALGSKPYRILAQVKHKGQPITMEGFKSFVSVLGANDFGLLLSTGGFTKDVVDELHSGSHARLNAMDLAKFFDLWVKNYDRLTQDAKLRLPLKEIYFLSPPDSVY